MKEHATTDSPSNPTTIRHWTIVGRVVYNRPPNRFRIKDVDRILDHMQPPEINSLADLMQIYYAFTSIVMSIQRLIDAELSAVTWWLSEDHAKRLIKTIISGFFRLLYQFDWSKAQREKLNEALAAFDYL